MTRKKVLFVLLGLLLLGSASVIAELVYRGALFRTFRWALNQPYRPNVVLVVLDTLRADHLSQYGYERETSASLDALVHQSLLFENAYSTSSWTLPSVASVVSGLHPVRHRTVDAGDVLQKDITTLAEQLSRVGYRTVGFSDNIHITEKTGFGQGFDDFKDFDSSNALAYPDISRMMARATAWVTEWRDQRPFFMYLQPMNCHGPYKTPPSHRRDLLYRNPRGPFRYYGHPMRDIMFDGKIEKRKEVTDAYVDSLNEQYDTAIRYATDQLGALFQHLRNIEMWDDTLVVFMSDHGEELFDHGGFSHGYTLHNEVVRVPLIIKLPGQRTAGTRDGMVSVMDIYPTIMDLLDITPARVRDGKSLLPLFDGVSFNGNIDTHGNPRFFDDRYLLANLGWKERGVIASLFDKRFKLIDVRHDYSGRKNTRLLYLRKKDVAEKRNAAPVKRETVEKMLEQLHAYRDAYAEHAVRRKDNILYKMNRKALKALGYLR